MLRAGALNRRVTIQKPGPGVNEWNEPTPDQWVDVCKPWANIKHLSGSETIRADAVISAVKASIRIRYRTGLDAGMRVLHGAKVYAVKAVMPDEVRREFMDLACEVLDGI